MAKTSSNLWEEKKKKEETVDDWVAQYQTQTQGGTATESQAETVDDWLFQSNPQAAYDELNSRLNAWGNQASYWRKKHNTRSEKYGQDGYRADYGDWHGTVSNAYSSMQREEDEIRAYIDKYGKYIDPEWTKSVLKYVDSGHSTLEGIYKSASFEKDYFSKWKDEKSYLKDLDAQKAYEAERAELAKPIGVLEADLSALEREFAKWESTTEYDWTDTNQRKAYTEKCEEYKQQIEQKKKLVERAEKHQKYSAVLTAADFDDFSKPYSNGMQRGQDDFYDEVNSPLSDPDTFVGAMVRYGTRNASKNPVDFYFTAEGESAYGNLTDEELSIFNYLYATEGKKSAKDYINWLQTDRPYYQTLNARAAEARHKNMDWLDKSLYWIPAGFDQFAGGVKQLFSEEALPTSITQYQSGLVREDAYDTWKGLGYLYDTGTTVGNMLPSIAVSAMTGNPVLGTVTMGASASGNAYNQALKEGYSTGEAAAYGMLVGISEASLQSILGGVSKLSGSGNFTSKVMSKVSQIDKMLPRLAAKYAVALGGEILEEELQLLLEPAFKTIFMGEDYDAPEIEEILETALITALSTGALESPGIIGGEVKTYSTGKAITGTENGLTRLKQLSGDLYSAASPELKTKVDNLTQKVDNSKGRQQAWNAANLYSTVGEMATQANVNDISKSLARKGFSEAEANKIAGAIVASANGVSLTKEQSKLLKSVEKDERVQQTITDLIKNQSSTVRQTQDKLHQFEAGVYMENAAQRMKKQQSKTKAVTKNATTQNTVAPTENTTATGKESLQVAQDQEGSSTSLESASRKYGAQAQAMIHTYKQGQDVAKYDAAYHLAYEFGKNGVSEDYAMASDGTAYLTEVQRKLAYEAGTAAQENSAVLADALSDMNLSPEDADLIRSGYDGNITMEAYASGVKLAYDYGNMGRAYQDIDDRAFGAALPENIRKAAYNLGKKALETDRSNSYNNTIETEAEKDVTGEKVHLRRGIQRTDGKSPDGSVREVVEGTGTVPNRQKETAGRPGDGGENYGETQSKISTKDLGVPNGAEDKTLRYVSKETAELKEAKALAQKHGLELVAFEGGNLTVNAEDGAFEARAYIYGNKVAIRADHPRFSLMQLLKHEIGHHKIHAGKVDMKKVYNAIADFATEEYVRYVIESYVAAYASLQGYDADYILEEILCDYEAGMNIFSEESVPDSFWEMSQEIMESDAVKTDSVRGPPAEDRTSRETKKVNTFLRQFTGEVREGEYIYLSNIEKATIGSNIKTRFGHISPEAKRGVVSAHDRHNGYTYHFTCNADYSVTVIDVLDDVEDRVIIDRFLKEIAGNGSKRVRQTGKRTGAEGDGSGNRSNDGTASEKTQPRKSFAELDGRTSESNGQRDSRSGREDRSDRGADQTRNTPKIKFSRDSNGDFLTKEQQEYFRDSKVRDEQGRLLVMYRGDTGDFTVFDRKKSSYSNLYGRGFYFTNSKSQAGQYGNTKAFYLNITNPLSTAERTITKAQMRKFLEAVAANEEDFSFENYGYGATVDSVLKSVYSGKTDFAMVYDVSQTAIGDMVGAVELFNEVNGTDYDGFILDTETVAFRSNQAKNVNNVHPTADADVRFSREFIRAQMSEQEKHLEKVNKVLEKDIARLREDNEHLKQLLKLQREVTGGTKFTKSSVEAMARQLKTKADARGDTKALAAMLNSFYEFVASSRELSWQTVMEQAQPIVDWLAENKRNDFVRDEYAQRILDDMWGRSFHLDDEQKGEAAYAYGSYQAFRQKVFGTVTPSDKAIMSLDEFWKEMAAEHPYYFHESVNSGDQVTALVETLETLRNAKAVDIDSTYNHSKEMDNRELLYDVYDSFWRVSTLRTVADSKQREINALKSKHYTRMEQLKRDHRETTKQLEAEYRLRMDALRQAYKARTDEKIRKVKAQNRENRRLETAMRTEAEAVKKNRSVVEKHAKALMNMLAHPTKDLHVPTALQGPLQEFLDSIDFTSVTSSLGRGMTIRDIAYTRALLEVRNAVAGQRTAMENDAKDDGVFALDVPGNFLEEIDKHITAVNNATKGLDLTTNRVYDMSSAELHDLGYILGVINKSIRDIDKLHMAGAKARVSELGQSTLREMKGRKKVDSKTGSMAMWANYIPWHAFRRMGTAAQQVFKGLMQGQAKLAKTANAVIKFAEKTYKSDEVKSWESERHTIKLDSGETVVMTPAQIMSFYCLSSRKHGIGHLVGGGIHIDTVKRAGREKELNQTDDFLLTENDIANINSHLTERQIEVANALQQYMQRLGGKLLNEISMARWDFMQATEEDYFPIKTMDTGRDARGPEQDKANLWALLNKSFTKGLTEGANNTVIIGSIFDVFAEHMSETAEYNAFALPLVDAMRWFNYRERIQIDDKQIKDIGVKRSIRDTLGTAAEKYFIDLMLDINSSQKAGRHEDLFAKILSRSKVAAVGWNLRVAIQQPTAILRASLILDMPSLLQGAVRIGSKELVKEMQKYSGVALWKSMGYYDLNISRGLTEQIKRDKSRLDKVNDAGMWLPGKMDEITWARIWAATKEKVSKEQNLTGEELLQATADLFEDVVYQTQVADSVLTRSSNMRSKSQMMREATSFMTEPTVSFNILLSAFQDYERGHSTWYKAKRGLMIGFCGYVLPSVANALVTALMDAWRDDDEYEEFYEKYLQALFGEKGFFDGNLFSELNPLEKVIFVKDAISALKGYSLSTSYGALIEDTVGLYDTFAKILSGKKKLDYNTVYSALQVFGNVVGFGSSNIAREVVGIWNNTFGKLYDKPIHRTEINDRSKIKNAYTTGALTQKEAMQALVEYGVVDTEDDAYFIVQEWANGADYSKYGDLYDAVLSGRSIDKAMKELIDHGCDEDDVVNQIRSQVRKWYKNSEISKKRAADMLVKYTDLDEDDAMLKTDYWEWQTQNPGFKELSESAYIQYTEICEPIGIELGVFYDCWRFFNETTADYNSNGKPIPDSKKKKVKAYIYGLDIPVNQKRILLACWYN